MGKHAVGYQFILARFHTAALAGRQNASHPARPHSAIPNLHSHLFHPDTEFHPHTKIGGLPRTWSFERDLPLKTPQKKLYFSRP